MTRANFTAKTKRQAHERSNGICECSLIPHVFDKPCGRPIGDANCFYEHVDCDALSHDNSLANCAVLTKACWHYKTNHYDKPTIAKSNHVRDAAWNIKRPKGRPLPGTKASGWRHKINGTWERRT